MANYSPVDLKALEKRICSPSKVFLDEGTRYEAHRLLIHKDRGAKVLGVAHLDFVGEDKPHMAHCATKKGTRIVWSDRLDDRLGAYLLLDYLPSIGVEMDVLLTDDEEKGRSTAAEFVSPKEYNWLVMFDRHGTELVMYQYETPDLCKLVEGHGFKVGCGSFSCIGKMESMGVAGFNVGTGYYNEHSIRSYAILNEVEEQANKFAAMFQQYKDVKLVHDKKKASRRVRTYSSYGGYGGYSGYDSSYDDAVWDPAKWEKIGAGYRLKTQQEQDEYKKKRANPYGGLDSGGSDDDTKEFTVDELGLTPKEIAQWNREKDFHNMTDEEWAEFCGQDQEMRAADAAYYRIKNQV